MTQNPSSHPYLVNSKCSDVKYKEAQNIILEPDDALNPICNPLTAQQLLATFIYIIREALGDSTHTK